MRQMEIDGAYSEGRRRTPKPIDKSSFPISASQRNDPAHSDEQGRIEFGSEFNLEPEAHTRTAKEVGTVAVKAGPTVHGQTDVPAYPHTSPTRHLAGCLPACEG